MSFVYKPTRKIDGKRIRSNLFSGRYNIVKGGRWFTVGLNTPDRETAEKRLRDIVVEKQREGEGLISPRSIRETAVAPILDLVDAYERDLKSLGRVSKHVHDTLQRVRRIVKETRWRSVGEIRSDQFVNWRATLQTSAKTKKEYQISLNAFLNWLVKTDRLATNPLARLPQVETRGKEVRVSRPYTSSELQQLFEVAGKHKLAYQVIYYSGQRVDQVRALVWGDIHLDDAAPRIVFRIETVKDKEERVIQLGVRLAAELRQDRPADWKPTDRVFWHRWPTYDIFRRHLRDAGIERKNSLGQVVHRHAMRKTYGTNAGLNGIPLVAVQKTFGHSTPELTANVYTALPAIGAVADMDRLPWISEQSEARPQHAQYNAQNSGVSSPVVSLTDILRQLQELAQATGTDGVGHALALPVTPSPIIKMAARAGIEPATK